MSDIPLSSSPIYKTMISDGHKIFPISTIEFQGSFWLVPEWLTDDAEGWQMPARIIGLGPLQPQDLRGRGIPNVDFSVPAAIPRTVLEALFQGTVVDGWPVKILERPPIRFPKRPAVH